jgi:hypothetical protein
MKIVKKDAPEIGKFQKRRNLYIGDKVEFKGRLGIVDHFDYFGSTDTTYPVVQFFDKDGNPTNKYSRIYSYDFKHLKRRES